MNLQGFLIFPLPIVQGGAAQKSATESAKNYPKELKSVGKKKKKESNELQHQAWSHGLKYSDDILTSSGSVALNTRRSISK
ncbi:hypothetical protein QG37_06616 [Candidozyma auris]|nr:hypothetical protein QG37_06616 [[Candida] auris]